jgi:hypothetical protein
VGLAKNKSRENYFHAALQSAAYRRVQQSPAGRGALPKYRRTVQWKYRKSSELQHEFACWHTSLPVSVVQKWLVSVVLQDFFEKSSASCCTLSHDVYNDILIFTRRLYGLAIRCGDLV